MRAQWYAKGVRLPVVYSCGESWDDMPGSRKQRHCSACDRDVFDLSAMRESEALSVLALLQTRALCVRYLSKDDGHIIHQPEPRPLSLHLAGLRTPLAVGALAVALTGASCAPALTDMKTTSASAQPATQVPAGDSGQPKSCGNDGSAVPVLPPVCPPDQVATLNGCEDRPRATMGVLARRARINFDISLFFDRGKHDLKPSAQSMIDEIVRVLKVVPGIRKVAIKSYVARDETNAKGLSAARANAVRDRLIAASIDQTRLVVEVGGHAPSSDPSVKADDPQMDRRVDFEVIEEDGFPPRPAP